MDNEYSKAIEQISKAVSINPSDTEALYQKAQMLSDIGQYIKGIQVADQALKVDPGNTKILYYKFMTLSFLGFDEDAKAVSKEILNSNPKDCAQWIAKGDVQSIWNRYNEACESFKRADEIDPVTARSSLPRAFHHDRFGEYDQAINICNNALKIGELHGVYAERAVLYYKKGAFDKALKDINEAISIRDDIPVYWERKGNIQEAKGDLKNALYSYMNVTKLGEDNEEVMNRISMLLCLVPNPMVKTGSKRIC